MIKKRLYC